MAIVRGQNGKFYEVDENLLTGKEVTGETAPAELLTPDLGPVAGPGASAPASGLIQIVVNVPDALSGGAGAPPQGAPAPDEEAGEVSGRVGCGWYNNWQNCWRNNWHNWRNWRNNWRNCWRNCY